MSSRNRREERSYLSNADRAKQVIRQAFQQNSPSSTTESLSSREQFRFHLYDQDREERINNIIDDDDDIVVHRQPQKPSPSSSIMTDRNTRNIEANDRRHDAVIFGDKKIEEQQRNQLWDSFKFSSKYATTSLAGPLLLEDPEEKRQRWKRQMRDLWMKKNGFDKQTIEMDSN